MRELGPVLKYYKTLLFGHSELGNLTKTFLFWCFADQEGITYVCMAQWCQSLTWGASTLFWTNSGGK